jgi:hypothetical protein
MTTTLASLSLRPTMGASAIFRTRSVIAQCARISFAVALGQRNHDAFPVRLKEVPVHQLRGLVFHMPGSVPQ